MIHNHINKIETESLKKKNKNSTHPKNHLSN